MERIAMQGPVEVEGQQVHGLFREIETEEVPCGWCDTTRYFDAAVGGKLIRQDINIRVKEGVFSEGGVKI